jgi:type IV pilus assembly protein PilW
MMMSQKGFTLIETMVAMVIGLFLVGGVITVFVNISNSNRIQENLSGMQENARFAFFFLNKDLRQSGYFGGPCVTGVASSVNNTLNDASSSFDSALHEFDSSSIINSITGVNGVGTASDSITVKAIFDRAGGVHVSDSMSTNTDAVNLEEDIFRENSILLITDCNYADIFQIDTAVQSVVSTSDSSKTVYSVTHGTSSVTSGPGNKVSALSHTYQKGSFVYPLPEERLFEIVGDQLLRNGEVVANNIEQMQLRYGVATSSSSGAPAYYSTIDTITDVEDIVSIEVRLLVVSEDDNIATTPQTYQFNGQTITATDNRLRREFITTIALRNRIS